MNKVEYKLCYIEQIDEYSNVYKMYFTDNLAEQWGDDWNDRPASSNAGTPYNDKTNLTSLYVEFSSYRGIVFGGNLYSVQDLNCGKAPWLTIGDKFFYGGDTLVDTLSLIHKTNIPDKSIDDAKVYLEVNGDDI